MASVVRFIESKKNKFFRERGALMEQDYKRLALSGGSGAFRERVRNEGLNVRDLTVGTLVQGTISGAITGTRMVKCGIISSTSISTDEIWGEEAYKGKVEFQEHDIDVYPALNGILTTQWTTDIPWKVKIQTDEGKWKSVKKGALAQYNFTDLSFRLNVQPVSDCGAKVYIGCVPHTIEELTAMGGGGSRFFPTIKVVEARAKLFPMELPHHKFGVAVQPLFLIEDARVADDGDLDLENVTWPNSQTVKDAQSTLLGSATMPNFHLTFDKWKSSVAKGNFDRRESALKWPVPRREEEDTEESGLEDSDGECGNGVEVLTVLTRLAD